MRQIIIQTTYSQSGNVGGDIWSCASAATGAKWPGWEVKREFIPTHGISIVFAKVSSGEGVDKRECILVPTHHAIEENGRVRGCTFSELGVILEHLSKGKLCDRAERRIALHTPRHLWGKISDKLQECAKDFQHSKTHALYFFVEGVVKKNPAALRRDGKAAVAQTWQQAFDWLWDNL